MDSTGTPIVHDFARTAGQPGDFEAPDAISLAAGDLLAVQHAAPPSPIEDQMAQLLKAQGIDSSVVQAVNPKV